MKFIYTAKKTDGETKTGEIEAADIMTAGDALKKQNLYITSLSPAEKAKTLISFLDKITKIISLKDKILFTQQLAVMLQSGYSLAQALNTLEKQTENKNLAKVIKEILEEVRGGVTFSTALEKRPNIFPQIYSQLVKSGEKSGKLYEVLNKLADDLTKSHDLNSKILSALIYPAFILVALIAVIIIIIIFVIPQLQSLFKEVNVSLPLATRILISLSDAFIHYWWLIIISLIALIFLYLWIIKIPEVRSFIDKIKLKTPVFGQLQKKAYLARFTRTLSTLNSAGLPVLDTLDTLIGITNNVHFKKDLEESMKKIEAGISIGEALRESKNFPPLISDMISVGEKAGNLEFILKRLTRFLEKDVLYMSKNLTTLIEPILMIVMGVGVAFILISVLGPIYNLVQVIK